MTVCIAAIYQDDEEQQGIVFCADGRLSHTWAGSTDQNVKTFDIGHGWTSLIATDNWTSGVSFRDHVREGWENLWLPEQRRKLTKQFSRLQRDLRSLRSTIRTL